ncbi:PadR family transcriptional regulator [Candidatus Saccharibacteria bacterium]|jgi:PadR family transcriptional regulator PadR|nr:MAG: PadR family transcriptional regulator [Candidatus Saccharibacteria bacterium]
MNQTTDQNEFVESSAVQMKKGALTYAVLLLCSQGKVYSSQIIVKLHASELIVVEGTLYPLLNRLAGIGLLGYEWQESEQGPPRKYYWLTDEGKTVMKGLAAAYKNLNSAIKKLEGEKSR